MSSPNQSVGANHDLLLRANDRTVVVETSTATKLHERAAHNRNGNHQQIDIGDNNGGATGSIAAAALGPFSSDQDVAGHHHIVAAPLLITPSQPPAASRSGQPNGAGTNQRVKFRSLLESATVINECNENSVESSSSAPSTRDKRSKSDKDNCGNSELIDLANFSGAQSAYCDTSSRANNSGNKRPPTSNTKTGRARQQIFLNETIPEEDNNNLNSDDSDRREQDNLSETDNEDSEHVNSNEDEDEDDDDDEEEQDEGEPEDDEEHDREPNSLSISPSHHKLKSRNTFLNRFYRRLQHFGSDLTATIAGPSGGGGSNIAYTAYEDASGQPTSGSRKYRRLNRQYRNFEQNFRGSYRYSRVGIMITIFKKLLSFLVQRSTLALFGAFLIHVTLGTIYTLSNINSYLTSYMRKHGSPNATYGGSMWISSSYAVGQGMSMVLGGLIERRFSARVSCILGCALHSLSIMGTAKAVDYGQLAVIIAYGFLPGFGCGLAYMTPMSNGFGWFPHRKGLVAGVILAGFGIGTFVFNMAQTAYVNPNNLSPPKDSGGYFTQDAILNNVPHLFTFLGTIYASMQFIGCCLLFKPPPPADLGDGGGGGRNSAPSDERPILMETEMSFKKAVGSREFIVLFLVFGITNQGVLFVNSMLKEYGQLFIADDLYLAWTGSMASIANSLGRLVWGMAIDRFTFTQCFTSITCIFGALMFLMPFEFILSSKLLYLLCTLGIFGSFSGWMSTYPVHLSRIFGLSNSGMIYGLIFVSQSLGGILTAFAAHYLIDQYSRFVPFFCVTFLEVLGLAIYHLFYQNK